MPKKKKTRKQKVVADTRHKEYLEEPLGLIQKENSSNLQVENNETPRAQLIGTANYSYLYSDLLKTFMLTISVIVVELVLRYFVFGA